jgi:hypothetical protein
MRQLRAALPGALSLSALLMASLFHDMSCRQTSMSSSRVSCDATWRNAEQGNYLCVILGAGKYLAPTQSVATTRGYLC